MIYVASPYSHPTREVRDERYRLVRNFTIEIIKKGHPAFSPIMYMHEAAERHSLPLDAAFWHNFNMQFLRKADGMYVLQLEGWMQSKGVLSEISTAEHIHIPITYIEVTDREAGLCG